VTAGLVRARVLAGVGVAVCAVAALAGCGDDSKSSGAAGAPTVSLWVSATAGDYRQVAAGTKLALAERSGRAGAFRVNYAGKQVSDDQRLATADAVANARTSLQDTQASAVLTNVATKQAEPALTLLNEAGIPAVVLGDDALKATVCSDRSDVYPNGHATAIVVPSSGPPMPAAWRARFSSRLGFAPNDDAWRAYTGASAVLSSIASPAASSDDSPPRLDRDALAAELVRAHGNCG
jgi:ABC-type branched-subunit amino acid transport system substrate-binding protein